MSYNRQMDCQGRPEVPYPWVAEWDYDSNCWLFVNREGGQRTYEYPVRPFNSYQDYGGTNNQDHQEPLTESHSGRNTAFGAMGGLASGALLMHEGDKIGEDWDREKATIENEAANLPENAATWTGEKVQEAENIRGWVDHKVDKVENIPQDIETGFDNAVEDVEDMPEDIATWGGRKVGEVEDVGDDIEQYGDRLDDNYDAGRDEGRYDDNPY